MKKAFLFFLVFSTVFVYGQERKTFKGKYPYHGNTFYVEYDYIETKDGRVFDGHFNIDYGRNTGNFKNGLKDGVWTFYAHNGIVTRWKDYKTQKRTYISGKLNGPLEEEGKVIFWYKDNHFTGNFSLYNLTGQFDSDGYADGEWIKYGERNGGVRYKSTQKWEHGYLISYIQYIDATGETIDQLDNYIRWGYKEIPLWKLLDNTDDFGHSFIRRYFFDDCKRYNDNELYIHTMGEYCMTVFPFRGIKDIKEIEREKAEKERKEREIKEKIEREAKEKLYQEFAKYYPDKSAFEKEYDKIGREAMTNRAYEVRKIYIERDILYRQFAKYYPDKSAFEKEYDKIGKEAMTEKAQEVQKICIERDELYQQFAKYYPNRSAFEILYDQLDKESMLEEAQKEADRQDFETLKLLIDKIKSANFEDTKDKSGMIKEVASFKDRVIYPSIIQFVIENNKNLSKKWKKEGSYFNNQTEFYEACTSGEYKTILKEKKNAMK